MHAREEFHKAVGGGLRNAVATFALLGFAACVSGDVSSDDVDETPGAEAPVATSQRATAMPPAGRAWIIFGADTVVAEVAATAEERAKGLMYREAVPDGTGMLFVFPDVSVRSFWMANTYVPLDIAFLDPAFNVVDIIAMQPLVTENYVSKAPAMYGLEVRQGWFAEHAIAVGSSAQAAFGGAAR